ncbi:hypothetical protein [Streptomyces sp. NBC_00443]|uniref:hypothetical protein n=1 Tax=Streptomyces sp. NBC_00443 TaxID=2975743 RepID=UPI002E1AD04F
MTGTTLLLRGERRTLGERELRKLVREPSRSPLVQWLAVTTARQEELSGRRAQLMVRVAFAPPLRTLTRGSARLPVPGDFLDAVS